jgi:serine phosphatase RsbU (regulator of sigma subunit)
LLALVCLALLCALAAWPVAAAPPADRGKPAGPPGQAKKAAKAKGPTKAKAPKLKATKARTFTARSRPTHSPPGLADKPRARGNAEVQADQSAGTGVAAAAAATGATAQAAQSSRAARRVRAAAAARRRATAARRREVAAARRAQARRVRAARAFAASAGSSLASDSPSDAADRPFAADDPGDAGSQFVPIGTADEPQESEPPQPLRVVRDIVEVVPTPVRILLAALAALSIILAIASLLTLLRNRRLAEQRRDLLGDVGLLQAALLPELPKGLAYCRASVAYRPADGPGAGGDFYDVLALAGGRTAVIIGDVSGHGRAALARTALSRYTLRAYVEAGLEPRETLQIAGSVLAGKLEGDFVTALVAVHDPAAATLTYATAGHPPPIVVMESGFDPVMVGTAPPLGAGAGTGQRQTTLPFPRGAVACFYTDGLAEARTDEGRLGTERLAELVHELGPDINAEQVIDRVADSARTITDDAAVCVLAAEAGAGIVRGRVERLEITRAELRGPLLPGFLDACGVSPHGVRATQRDAREVAQRTGGALIEVRMGERPEVDVRQPEIPLGDELPFRDSERTRV